MALEQMALDEMSFEHMSFEHIIIKRVSWFKSSLLLRIQSDSFTNINS
jgi:hypothetical protein